MVRREDLPPHWPELKGCVCVQEPLQQINSFLFVLLQELRGNIRVHCRVRPVLSFDHVQSSTSGSGWVSTITYRMINEGYPMLTLLLTFSPASSEEVVCAISDVSFRHEHLIWLLLTQLYVLTQLFLPYFCVFRTRWWWIAWRPGCQCKTRCLSLRGKIITLYFYGNFHTNNVSKCFKE